MVNARGDAMAVAACRGKMGAAEARRAMAGCALTGAVVSTDRQRSYVRALAEMGAAARRGFDSRGPRSPLNRVNAPHSAPKAFLKRFRSVSTRRLGSYPAWFIWAREAMCLDERRRCSASSWRPGRTARAGGGCGRRPIRSIRNWQCHKRVDTAFS